jgi:hypothetical protein
MQHAWLALLSETTSPDKCLLHALAGDRCAPSDLYYPHPWVQDVLWWTLYKAERLLLGSRLRKAALQEVMRHVHYEARLHPLLTCTPQLRPQ